MNKFLFDVSHLSQLKDAELLAANPLSGGLSNRCWKLSIFHPSRNLNADYVWRPNSAAAVAFGVDRQREYQLLKQISAFELSPKPLILLDAENESSPIANNPFPALLVEWLTGMEADKSFTGKQLCQLQANIHALPKPQWRLDVQQRATHYWHHICDNNKSVQLQRIYDFFQHQQVKHYFADTCCHFDLGRYNIIVSSKNDGVKPQVKIIDWEYASAGDPSLDLSMTIIANQLDTESAVFDYCHARKKQSPDFCLELDKWQHAVRYWQPWCQYLALLWYWVGSDIWQDALYAEQAKLLEVELVEVIDSAVI